MDDETVTNFDSWFNTTLALLNESYQLDLRRILSPETCELVHALCDFYMYDEIGLFSHLIAVCSHYLTSTSFVYADNQLKHKLNLHILLVVRSGYDRTRLVEHVKQSMVNVQSLRQTGQSFDSRHSFSSNLFCRFEDNSSSSMSSALCISDQYDEHLNSSHLQRHQSSTIIGTSNGEFIRKILDVKHQQNEHFPSKVHRDWLMIFLASKPNLFCRRSKFFDPGRYPSLEQWIIVIYSHCMNFSDFYFEDSQANQLVCDFLDTLALKSVSLEENHPWMSAQYLSAREQVIRVAASLRTIELAIETLIIYRRTFHSFSQSDKTFFDNCLHLIEQTRSSSTTMRITISSSVVQSAIYLVNASLKQYELMLEPNLNNGNNNNSDFRHLPVADRSWPMHSTSTTFPSGSRNSPSSSNNTTTTISSAKRLKTYIDPSYVKSLELAYELLLLPFVGFTRTSLYANSKLKRNAAYLDSVIDELKKSRLLILVRQGVQMVDGTRRRVDLLVKTAPLFRENQPEQIDDDLSERLGRFGVDYERYVQTLSTLDIGEKYRLSNPCFELLNSPAYKKFLTIDIERMAPLNRLNPSNEFTQHFLHRASIQNEQNQEIRRNSSSSSSLNVKHEPEEFFR